jgi:hypothetical protein
VNEVGRADAAPGGPPTPNPRYLPTTFGCLLLLFLLLLAGFVADVLRRLGMWQLPAG